MSDDGRYEAGDGASPSVNEVPKPVRRAARRRAVLAVAPACVLTPPTVALPVLLHDRLPPDAEWSYWSWTALATVVGTLAVVGYVQWGRLYLVERQRGAVGIVWAAIVLATQWTVGLVVGNLDREGAALTEPPSWWASTPAVAAALSVAALLGWLAAAPDSLPDAVRPPRYRAPRPSVAPTWIRTYGSTGDYWLAGVLGVTAALRLVNPVRTGLVAGSVAAAVGVWVLARARLRLEVDEQGLRLVQPLLGRRTLLQVARADVASTTVLPMTAAVLRGVHHGLFWRGTQVGYRDRTTGTLLCLQLTSGDTVLVSGPRNLVGDASGIALTWFDPTSPSPRSAPA